MWTTTLLIMLQTKPTLKHTQEMLTNSHSLFALCFCWDIFQTRRLNQIDIGFGFDVTLNYLGNLPPVSCARGRPQLTDCCDDAAAEVRWSVYDRKKLLCVLFNSS